MKRYLYIIILLQCVVLHAFAHYNVSPYAYCMGDPVNMVDPDGMDVWDINDEGRILNGYTIREINHSHPNSPMPSAADLRFRSEIQTIYGSHAPQMNIWNVNTRQYLPF